MKKALILMIIFFILSCKKEKSECEEYSKPYWYNEINSRIEGESKTLRKVFKGIQQLETNIKPANGFITLRLHISKTGNICNIEKFQIDNNYENTEFNEGKLIVKLEEVATKLTEWRRDKDFKTYNLIRFKIKNGRIEEIF